MVDNRVERPKRALEPFEKGGIMEISSRFAGTALKEYRTEIAWRDMMNYAAAVEDHNPVYFDDERPEGIVAHPMFCVAVTGRIVARVWEHIEARDFPRHVLATRVHYTEHLAFHRPIKPGDSLTITGEIAAILPHRLGAHVAVRLEAADRDGLPVFTEHVGALLRGVKCAGEGKGRKALPPTPRPPTQKPPIWEAVVSVDPLRPFVYDGCSGISFPIHTSRQFAHQVGLPDIILHGTATLAYAVRELVNREAAENPLLLQSLQCRFSAMVLPNTEICVQLTGKTPTEEGVDLNFAVLNQDGRRAISKGYACLKKES